ncbi:hypothetical protein [Synechococcus sp. 1G10]|uniref:hypothetical protein n=1 Tax=Synechococcus sp. 1G10 TaxID=2025605 RepID=UPI00117F0875|nr:hypothetical protein [Synechococcus sp. 1G10]
MESNSEIVKAADSSLRTNHVTATNGIDEVTEAAQALIDALQRLAQSEIQSVSDHTEELYQGIDKAVKKLRDEHDRTVQKVSNQVDDIDERLTEAAKAAWAILTAPSSNSESASR